MHFDVATDGAIGHYDGEPNPEYFESIQSFMNKTFSGWDHQPKEPKAFLQDYSTTRSDDFEAKFPFVIHRFGDVCYTKKETDTYVIPGAVQARNTPAGAEPPNRTSGFIVSGANIRTKGDPRTSAEDLRLAKLKADGVRAGQSVNDSARYRPQSIRNIELFNMAIEHFRQTGHRWPTSMVHTTMLTGLKDINTDQAFENWLLRTQTQHDRVSFEVTEIS